VSLSRRHLLATSALGFMAAWTDALAARAEVVKGALPWKPDEASPPTPVMPGPWKVFNDQEAQAVEAIVDRLIPPDPTTPGGKDAGCAVYIDRQLAGPYGGAQNNYMQPPFAAAAKGQGNQTSLTPKEIYQKGLAALDNYCHQTFAGAAFAALTDEQKDQVLQGLENGSIMLAGIEPKTFFEQILQNTQEGFFADPVYGGNRDMVGWKMIGFPGARYDYRDWVERHNERYPLPPMGIMGRPAWTRAARKST
jgi:gluconate 2-dehydrogenase gamma chain